MSARDVAMVVLGAVVASALLWPLARVFERHRRARRDLRAVWWTLRNLIGDLVYLTGQLLRLAGLVVLGVLALGVAAWAALRR